MRLYQSSLLQLALLTFLLGSFPKTSDSEARNLTKLMTKRALALGFGFDSGSTCVCQAGNCREYLAFHLWLELRWLVCERLTTVLEQLPSLPPLENTLPVVIAIVSVSCPVSYPRNATYHPSIHNFPRLSHPGATTIAALFNNPNSCYGYHSSLVSAYFFPVAADTSY